MQALVNEVFEYFQKWKQKMNPNKCELILFREPLKNGPPNLIRNWKKLNVKIENTIIKTNSNVKYLGIQLDDKLNYNIHAKLR